MAQLTIKPYDINDALLKATELLRVAQEIAAQPGVTADAKVRVTEIVEGVNTVRRDLVFLGQEARKGILRWLAPATGLIETMTFDVRFATLTEKLQLYSRALAELQPTYVVPKYQAIEKQGDAEAERRAKEIDRSLFPAFDLGKIAMWGAIGIGVYYGGKLIYEKFSPRVLPARLRN